MAEEADIENVASKTEGEDRSISPGFTELGPAYALLRIAYGDRIPSGPLGPETVPAAVLEPAIDLATKNLVQHLKGCRNLKCPRIPPPLLRFRRMRPDAIRAAKDAVYRVLWTHLDHSLVAWVRQAILNQYKDLAEELTAGRLFEGDQLFEFLRDKTQQQARLLATVLWALKFDGPHAEVLFRILVPFAGEGPTRLGSNEAAREHSELVSVRTQLKDVHRQLSKATKATTQADERSSIATRQANKAKRELEQALHASAVATDALRRIEEDRTRTASELRARTRDAERAMTVVDELREDLRKARDRRRDFELQRSEFARLLGEERRHVEKAKIELASIPQGKEAVFRFLRAEEERIQEKRLISEGGVKLRADEEWAAYRKLERAFIEAYPEYREPPPDRLIQKTPLRLVTLGGSGEVGRSCYLLELGKFRILVDCGIKPSGKGELHPRIEALERLDALVLTHAHSDHIGWVPALVRRFPELEIYCSKATAALLPVMLDDCHAHYMREMAAASLIRSYSRRPVPIVSEYDDEDLQRVSKLVITCDFDAVEGLSFGGASVRFYRAGHIAGAASVLIEDLSGRRVFMSGDFSSFPQLTVSSARWPEDIDGVDLLVLESTYGGATHPPFDESRRELVAFIAETTNRGGSVILASFALGRAQELLKLITTARQQGDLSRTIPIHVDGMIRRINPIYQKYADFDLPSDAFNEVTGEAERREIVASVAKTPSIIVTTSGMLTGGPVLQYAEHLLPDPRHRIVLTGYQDEGAPSKALKELIGFKGPYVVRYRDERGEELEFAAAMPAQQVRLSSHADQPGLLEYSARLRPGTIALVHGEAPAQRALQSKLRVLRPGVDTQIGPAELSIP